MPDTAPIRHVAQRSALAAPPPTRGRQERACANVVAWRSPLFTVEGYRSFVRRTTVQIRPLTLLFGYNSAGKSALLRTLPLLSASCGGGNVGPLSLDADVMREATYADVATRLSARNKLVLGLSWDDDEQPVRNIEIVLREEDKRHLVSELFARGTNGAELLRAIDVPGEPGRYEVTVPGRSTLTVTLPFKDLRPILSGPTGGIPEDVRLLLGHCTERLASLPEAVQWLGAVRAAPERRGAYQGEPARISNTGEAAAAKLASRCAREHRATILRRVSGVLRQMFGQGIDVGDLGKEFALEMEPVEGSPLRISIVDVGEGVSQVLPVLVLCAAALAGELPAGAVLAIEQPEMHLHPRAERALAELFAQVVKAPHGVAAAPWRHTRRTCSSSCSCSSRAATSGRKMSRSLWVEYTAQRRVRLPAHRPGSQGTP